MLTDQLSSILSDTTAIERLKKDGSAGRARADSESCLYALSETFGRPCSLMWLVPTSVKFNGLTYEQLGCTELAYSVPYDEARHGGQARAHRHRRGCARGRRHEGSDGSEEEDEEERSYRAHMRGAGSEVADGELADYESGSDSEPLAPRFARTTTTLSGPAPPEQLVPRTATRHADSDAAR